MGYLSHLIIFTQNKRSSWPFFRVETLLMALRINKDSSELARARGRGGQLSVVVIFIRLIREQERHPGSLHSPTVTPLCNRVDRRMVICFLLGLVLCL